MKKRHKPIKNIEIIVNDLREAGLIKVVALLRPPANSGDTLLNFRQRGRQGLKIQR